MSLDELLMFSSTETATKLAAKERHELHKTRLEEGLKRTGTMVDMRNHKEKQRMMAKKSSKAPQRKATRASRKTTEEQPFISPQDINIEPRTRSKKSEGAASKYHMFSSLGGTGRLLTHSEEMELGYKIQKLTALEAVKERLEEGLGRPATDSEWVHPT